jgi:hypothetical protein
MQNVLTGGHHPSGIGGTRSSEKYKPESNTWSSNPVMSTRRNGVTTAVIDDKIFAIGGTDCKNRATNRVECFNDEENEWFVYS